MRLFIVIAVLLMSISPMLAGGITQCDSLKQHRIWLRPFGNLTQNDTAISSEVNFFSYGLTLGIDRQIGKNWLCGFAIGTSKTSAKISPLAYRDDINAFHTSMFVRRTFDRFFVDVEGNFGYNEHSIQRKATQWGLTSEAGFWWKRGLGRVEPYVRFSHIYWEGTGNDTKETLIAGVRYSWRTGTGLTTTVPRFYGGVIQELGNKSLFPVAVFADTPTVFPVQNTEVDGTRFFLGGGFTTSFGTTLDISLRYTAEVSSRCASHTVFFGVNCNF